MASSEKEKRCLYEVLGVGRDCSADDIRSAYKRLALQRHPDKLIKSGLSEAEATAQFQELVNAYEVLSDPRERAWYDSHRSQILFSSSTAGNSSDSVYVPNLFSYFSNSIYSGYSDSGKGFYKIYGDIFDKIYQNELNFAKRMGVGLPKEAPLMGNVDSPYAQVTAFYSYWTGFVTVMDFCWVDQYDVMAGPNRKSRRVMEEENKKLRKKARREYNETVRGLAEFAKKRDKRVIDMQLKRNEEMERKKQDEKKRKEEIARLKAEKARNYEEPEWAKIDEVEDEDIEELVEENGKRGNENELFCVACGKKFKSEKQWKNHEQSKKHKEKIAELRDTFDSEDREYDEAGSDERENEEEQEHENGDEAVDAAFPVDGSADDFLEQMEKKVGMGEDNNEAQSTEKDGFVSSDTDSVPKEQCFEAGAEDDELSILENMVSGQKNRNKAGSKPKSKLPANIGQLEVDNDEVDYLEYNNVKGSRRNKGGRRRRGGAAEEAKQNDFDDKNGQAEEKIEPDDRSHIHEPSSNSLPKTSVGKNGEDQMEKVHKLPKEGIDKKNTAKQDLRSRPKEAAKGKKASKVQSNVCEKCGEEFDSRNRLHKHLGDTGHASLKSR